MARAAPIVFDLPPSPTPLVATIDPITGVVRISHANLDTGGVPVFNATPPAATVMTELLDGTIFGIDKKLLLVGLVAYLLLKK